MSIENINSPTQDVELANLFPAHDLFNLVTGDVPSDPFHVVSLMAKTVGRLKPIVNYKTYRNSRGMTIADGYGSMTLINISRDGVEEYDSEFLLIDAGKDRETRRLDQVLSNYRLGQRAIKAVITTHAHSDHVGGVNKLVEANNSLPIYSSFDEFPVLNGEKNSDGLLPAIQDKLLFRRHAALVGAYIIGIEDEQILNFGAVNIRALKTPGHTVGHDAFDVWVGPEAKSHQHDVYVGDLLDFKRTGRVVNAPRPVSADVRASEKSVIRLDDVLSKGQVEVANFIPSHSGSGTQEAVREFAKTHK